ncbi:hypothetical protein ITP53_20970 [Nonomuraea sp. K274]|uniref:Uncharacterized protein n=1 Tax=Nonomuraea cypriaca TaxID=1187855 RepID=A0A931A854_9ACTN|nr:hypothetical protein [Nonomuraea cypriaca]
MPARLTRGLLRGLEWVANPALAGLAFCALALGVVTWLPALAAAGHALSRWRDDGDQRCFVATFRSFPRYWATLWRHGLVSTAVAAVLVANLVFLAEQASLFAFVLLTAQAGIAAALIPYHFALAAVAARDRPGDWRRAAVLLAFGSARRGLALLAAALVVPALTLPLTVGPLLFGPTIPLLVAIGFAGRA